MEVGNTKRCSQCGGPTRREVIDYEYMSLPSVLLVGVERWACESCGADKVVIPRIADLNRYLVSLLVRERRPLVGDELRFLRKVIGWSAEMTANHLGVSAEDVVAWEADRARASAPADRLLRMFAVKTAPVEDYSIDELEQISPQPSAPTRIRLAKRGETWARAA